MPHTKSRFEGQQGFADGFLMLGPEDIMVSGTAVLTRNAAGDWSINVAQSQAVIFGINVGKVIQRSGLADTFLEQFGSAVSDLADAQGIYGTDYTGNPITAPRTTFQKKGLKVVGYRAVYDISAVNLVAHTTRVDTATYANNAAPVIAAVVATGANGLATAFRANEYVTTVTFAAGQQIYRVTDLQDLVIEIAATTDVGGTYKLRRVDLLFEFNFN